MCNKVATPDSDQLHGYFDKQDVNQRQIFKIDPYKHYYHANCFDRPFLPMTASEEPTRILNARWKLLTSRIRNDVQAVKSAHTFNARSETIFELESYRDSIMIYRSLLWVAGVYEPNHPDKKTTIPYYIRAINKEPFTLGCVYSNWVNQDTGETYRTFSIITTPPNKLMAKVHNEGQRMPLIIEPADRSLWLGTLTKPQIIEMMQPQPDGYLEAYPVSGLVYKRGVDNNVPETQVPV
jgi:putative SOS response-associated peptidase YedK